MDADERGTLRETFNAQPDDAAPKSPPPTIAIDSAAANAGDSERIGSGSTTNPLPGDKCR